MALEVGAAVVSLIPSAKDFSANARKLLKAEMSGIGEQIGKGFGDDFAKGSRSTGKDVKDSVRKNTKDVDNEGERAGKGFATKFHSSVGTALKGFGAGLLAGIGIEAVKGLVGGMVEAGSKAEQTSGAVAAVFKEHSAEIEKSAAGASQAVALSANAYRDLATPLGAMLKNKGVADFTGQTEKMIKLGADLAAQFGGSTKDAVEAIGAAFRGESDPIEKYGVSLNEAAVDAKAAELGMVKVNGAFTEQQKTQARLALIMQQTSDAQGAATRETNTYEGQMQRAQAAIEDVKTTLGEALLPVFTDLMKFLNTTAIPAIKDFIQGFKDGTGAGGEFKAILEQVKAIAEPVLGFIRDNWQWLTPLAAGFTVAAGAVKLFNFMLMANPIGLIVGGIVILIGALVALYQNNETARNIIDGAWSGIKNAIGAVAGWITDTAIPGIVGAWNAMGDGLSKVKDGIAATWDKIKDIAAKPVSFVANTVIRDGIAKAWNAVASKLSLPTWDFAGVGFARGGWTGPGTKYQPAGIVHADEFVIRKEARGAFEASHPGALDYLNRTGRLPGYADGGLVISNPIAAGLKKLLELPFNAATGLIDGIGSRFGDSDWVRLSTEFAKKPVTSTRDFLDKLIDKVFPEIKFMAGGGAEQWASLGAKALEMTGQSLDNLPSLLRRMMQESGGNPTAINNWDSNAAAGIPSKGLMQVIDPTFRAYAMPGYDSDIWDPLSNILASIRYALSRYGSLSSAYDRAGGYAEGGRVRGPLLFDQGGYLPPGLSLVANHTGQPERVLNPSQEARLGAGSVYNIDVRGFSADEVVEKMVGSLDHASRKSRLARHLR